MRKYPQNEAKMPPKMVPGDGRRMDAGAPKSTPDLRWRPWELPGLIFDVQGLILELKFITFQAQSSTFQSQKLALESQEHAQDALSRW